MAAPEVFADVAMMRRDADDTWCWRCGGDGRRARSEGLGGIAEFASAYQGVRAVTGSSRAIPSKNHRGHGHGSR